jgi:hypothetical protein
VCGLMSTDQEFLCSATRIASKGLEISRVQEVYDSLEQLSAQERIVVARQFLMSPDLSGVWENSLVRRNLGVEIGMADRETLSVMLAAIALRIAGG